MLIQDALNQADGLDQCDARRSVELRPPTTFAEAIKRIENYPHLGGHERQAMISGLRGVATVGGLPVEAMPFACPAIRERLAIGHHRRHDLKGSTWANYLSGTRRALALFDLHEPVGRDRPDRRIPDAWIELIGCETLGPSSCALIGLAHYAAAGGIAPADITDAHAAAFLQHLAERTLESDPRKIASAAVRAFNRAGTEFADLPRLSLPRAQMPYVLPLGAFPASFTVDLALWESRVDGSNPFDERAAPRALKPSTIRHRGYQMRQLASAQVAAGRSQDDIVDIAAVVEPSLMIKGMNVLKDRTGKLASSQNVNLIRLATSLLRHHCRPDFERMSAEDSHATRSKWEADIARLQQMARKAAPPRRMGQRVAERLRQFGCIDDYLVLFALPERLMRLAHRAGLATARGRRLATAAVAIEIELRKPLRIANLAGLRIGVHLTRVPADGRWQLTIDGAEIKNGEHCHRVLPRSSSAIIDEYLERVWAPLGDIGNNWLFASDRPGQRRSVGSLRDLIVRTVVRETGFQITPHMFRALTTNFLKKLRTPGGLEIARRLLGDRSMQVVMSYYEEADSAEAHEMFDEIVEATRRTRRPETGGEGSADAPV